MMIARQKCCGLWAKRGKQKMRPSSQVFHGHYLLIDVSWCSNNTIWFHQSNFLLLVWITHSRCLFLFPCLIFSPYGDDQRKLKRFISAPRLVISGTMPPFWFLITQSPTRSLNMMVGSLAPPCCKNFDLRADPAAGDNGSCCNIFCHIVAAKHFAYK